MPPFLQFLVRRIFLAILSLIIITMLLYAGMMITPPEARARIYLPPGKGGERATEAVINGFIQRYHLDEPYLVQYAYWLRSLLEGTWGYSPTLNDDVLPSLLRRTPVTLELALLSLILLIPAGLASGLVSGWRPNQAFDYVFRSAAFVGTSAPPFILALVFLSIFYVKLGWFGPGRLDLSMSLELANSSFRNYTGMLTLDSLLNGRFDVFINALRHLAMPVMTLFLFHWSSLGRITRAAILGEKGKEYIVAAKARGVKESRLIWHHALRAVFAPSLTIMGLSAASIVTGTFVVEIIYNLKGVSEVIKISMSSAPDAPAAIGFTVYSVIMVIGLMIILDVIQAIMDPRVRDEVMRS
jgi:peptide/nickel transport system permease protein